MKKTRIIVFYAILFVALSTGTLTFIYDRVLLRPCNIYCEATLRDIYHEYSSISPQLRDAIYVCMEEDQVREWVAYWCLRDIYPRTNSLSTRIQSAIYAQLIRIHFSEQELLALWSHWIPLTFSDGGRGLNKASQVYYKREITGLTPDELITLLATLQAPEYLIKHPEELEKRIKNFQHKYAQIQWKE